ncbi:hypothetical protein ATCC90586_000570 [Pythium insidiosum]|nr:hypothetical protein ATCC90586_000570 [Pythium insidiosum]
MSGDSRGKDNKSSLAHRAQQKYNAGKYVEAMDALQKLSEEIAPARDLKVQHNLVVAGVMAGKYAPREFELHLRNLLGALADERRGDAFSLEREAAWLRYNLAASLFQQKQYAAASAVLEALIRHLGPVDEKVAMHVCFLYLDVILHSSRGCVSTERERSAALKKAQSILAYLDKPHSFNGLAVSTQASGDDPSGNSSSASAPAADATTETKKDDADVVEFRFRLHLYKAKMMLLQSNLKVAKKEVKSALEIFQKEIKARDRRDDGATGPAGAICSDRTSATLCHPSLAIQKTTGLFLKANLEYLRMNHKKCIKLLASCVQQAVDESLFLNNMGCIHFQMGQRKAAQSYFARALDASARSRKTPQGSGEAANSPQLEIMYNNGMQLLLQGDYALAFRCFHASSRLFFNRPKLWLRMGECCTAAFAQQAKLAATAGNKSGLIQGVVGTGSHRRVLLSTSQPVVGVADIELPPKTGKVNVNGAASNGSDGAPTMNLPFAAKCFKNVVLLCTQLMETHKAGASSAGAETDADTVEVSERSVEAMDLLRQKALVNLAYVYLGMYEPQLAITTTRELLQLPTCSKSNRFLARSYAAEAMCMLSRAHEATAMLQADRDVMQQADEYAKEANISVKQARAAVHVNNATSLILQNRFGEAEESVSRAVGESSSSRESLELLVYFYLKKGETKKALRVLKEAQVTG